MPPVTVDTSTTNEALEPDGIAVCANGVKWIAYDNGAEIELEYNDGGGWVSDGTVGSGGHECNLYIDADDYAHLVFIDGAVGVYYRGTPNGACTSWTWDGPYTFSGQDDEHNPRVVAHAEGTGWKAHVTFGTIDADSWQTGTWWYRRKCDHPSGGHAHTHSRTCGNWTTGTPASCAGFGSHAHWDYNEFCGPSCEAWPNNGNNVACGYTYLISHNHGVNDAGTDSYFQETGSGTDYYNRVYYVRFDITSGHVITTDSGPTQIAIVGNYNESHPVIDFAHTGDGKTPKANPHVYLAWQDRYTYTRYRRLPYSAGWGSWDAVVNIVTGVSTGYAIGGFNGSEFVVAYRDQTSTSLIKVWRVPDVTTPTPVAYAQVPALGGALKCYGMALDGDTVHLFAADVSDGDLKHCVYDGSWSSWDTIETAVIEDPQYYNNMAVGRHKVGSAINIAYLEGSASPWDIDFTSLAVASGGGWGFLPIGA
jgi:hypothetical protein